MKKLYRHSLSIKSNQTMIDITKIIKEDIKESGVKDGIIVVYCPHTTAGITINENAESAVKCSGSTADKSPEKITDIEATTDSLANSPVNKETEDCQFPKPRGLNIGAIKVPIEANILSFTSHKPWILKFDKNHNTMLIANITVPALVKKLLVFSNN